MKKILSIFTLIALITGGGLLTSCKNGEDGDDGLSATELILSETGNKWYKYNGDSDNTTNNTLTNGSESLATIYLKYDTSSNSLIMAAVGDSSYAQTSKGLTRGKWAASAVTLRVTKKITTQTTDPTKNKTLLTNFSDWGEFTIESLIAKLFDE